MLKKVALYDLLVGLFGAILTHIIFRAYSLLFLLGILMAGISFAVSSFVLSKTLSEERSKYSLISFAINASKIFIICIIGVLVYNNNIDNVIAYILGFTSHFIALILYGFINLLHEGK